MLQNVLRAHTLATACCSCRLPAWVSASAGAHGHTGTVCGRPSTHLRVRTYCLYLFHGTAKGLGWLAGTTRAVRASRDAMLCLLLVLRCVADMTELLLSVPVACDTRSAPMSQPVLALPCEIGMPPLLKELVSGCQKGDAKVFTPSLCAQATSAIIEHWHPTVAKRQMS